jgi:hypothetical protein
MPLLLFGRLLSQASERTLYFRVLVLPYESMYFIVRSTGSQVRLPLVDMDMTLEMSSFNPYSYVVGGLSASTLQDKIKLKLVIMIFAGLLDFLPVISQLRKIY